MSASSRGGVQRDLAKTAFDNIESPKPQAAPMLGVKRKVDALEGEATITPCKFLCGCDSSSCDPVERILQSHVLEQDLPRIRWAREGIKAPLRYTAEVGKGVKADYWCDRTYACKKAHRHPDRKKYQALLATDKNELDDFSRCRDELIANKSGVVKKKVGKSKKLTRRQERGLFFNRVSPW